MNRKNLIAKDLHHIWHPCAKMKDFERYPPLIVKSAQGSYIHTDQGPLIDGISSWWCKSLGHGHPAIVSAIREQLDQFEHVMPVNSTHDKIAALGEVLASISQKQHVFFASDGASAVEIALKLAIQATALKGQTHRNQFIALKHGYHGETLGTLAVSDLGLYKEAWQGFGPKCHFIDPLPYLNDPSDPLWQSADAYWPQTLTQLEPIKDKVCALILEPIVQGASGLRPYSADFLAKLAIYAKENDIYLITDEIMTGLGRTGKWLAAEHAGVEADMICLSKGLSSGSVPLSCVLIDHSIYDLFYQETDPKRCFLHSHTYSGNPLGIAAALATLQTMHSEEINKKASALGDYMRERFQALATRSGLLSQPRGIGAMVAADILGTVKTDFAHVFAQAAQEQGALLRPMGQTLYWSPPLNTDFATIDELAFITEKALELTLAKDKLCIA